MTTWLAGSRDPSPNSACGRPKAVRLDIDSQEGPQMTVHLSARIAWHMDGWNGRVCQQPSANTYCVGSHSYPGDAIRDKRDLPWEVEHAGRHCADLDDIPPCVYSINAFG